MNYDPNMVTCGKMAVQTVRLVFGEWEYRKTIDTVVGGNCRGFTVIEQAVESAFDKLDLDNDDSACISLKDNNGNILDCCDEEGKGSEWLKDMLISAEILDIKEYK